MRNKRKEPTSDTKQVGRPLGSWVGLLAKYPKKEKTCTLNDIAEFTGMSKSAIHRAISALLEPYSETKVGRQWVFEYLVEDIVALGKRFTLLEKKNPDVYKRDLTD